MEIIQATFKELKEDLKAGFITIELPIKELVQNAIIKEKYNQTVNITVENYIHDEILVQVNIEDYLTPKEHNEVLKLNGYFDDIF